MFLSVLLIICFFPLLQSGEVPFLNDENFEYELDYSFKARPAPERDKLDMHSGEIVLHDLTPLPYVKMTFKLLVRDDDYFRYRVVNDDGILLKSRKIKDDVTVLDIDMGYSDDIKDRVSTHIFQVLLTGKDKTIKSRIKVYFDEDGTMFINEIKRGKI